MCLNLAHCWNVTLRNLVVVFQVVLKSLIVIILHFFLGDRADFVELVGRLVVCLSHGHLVLRVQSQFRV